MNLESQVCSRELAKRLKELGVMQESAFSWSSLNGVTLGPLDSNMKLALKELLPQRYEESEVCSAFTVAELGEILHEWFNEWSQGYNDSGCFYHFQYGNRGAGSMIEGIGRTFSSDCDTGDTEANARAEFVIHLLEKGIVKL